MCGLCLCQHRSMHAPTLFSMVECGAPSKVYKKALRARLITKVLIDGLPLGAGGLPRGVKPQLGLFRDDNAPAAAFIEGLPKTVTTTDPQDTSTCCAIC